MSTVTVMVVTDPFLQLRSKVQMALWGGLTSANANDSKELNRMLKIGAVGFKAFMCPSGIDDFPPVSRCACHQCITRMQRLQAMHHPIRFLGICSYFCDLLLVRLCAMCMLF